MPNYEPVYANGAKPFTLTASAAVTGGTLAESTTTSAAGTAGAASVKVIGVFAHDAASGGKVAIWPLTCIHETTSTAGAPVGSVLIAGAGGTVEPVAAQTGFERFGLALTTGAAGAKVRWIGR